jgi:hypothetical protein
MSCIVAACATSGGASGDDEGGPPAGGAGGVGGMPVVGGMPPMGGFGGTPAPCAEDPCKLTGPQCGCLASEKCQWANDDRSCVPNGTKVVGEACAQGECEAGSICLFYGSLSICKKYCDDDAHCDAPGGRCELSITGFTQQFCTDNCDPVSSAGCGAANSKCDALGSTMGPAFTLCTPAGAGTSMAPCPNGSADCAEGHGCFNDGMMPANTFCLEWCNIAIGSCATGICNNLQTPLVIGSVTYGVCQ